MKIGGSPPIGGARVVRQLADENILFQRPPTRGGFWFLCYTFCMEQRNAKQLVVAVLYGILIIALLWGGYFLFRAKPTCTDGVKNQDEIGIDCGGVCSLQCTRTVQTNSLEIRESALLYSGPDHFDALISIHNPNDEAGASSFHYRMELRDAVGVTMAVREGESFILPQETKYLLEINVPAPKAKTVVISFSDYQWQRFAGYQEKPLITVSRKSYEVISSGVGFGKAFGVVRNESPFDFQSLRVKVVLRDVAGKPIGANITEMRTVASGAVRDFNLIWPTSFPGTVDHVETEVEADVFHSDNFIRQYMPTQDFQARN